MEDMVHDAIALRAREKLRTETDETTRWNRELKAHIACRLFHIGKLRLAHTETFHDSPHVFLWNFDGQVLNRLTKLTIDGFVDDFRLANLQLVAFAAHLLDQDGKMKLTAPRNTEDISGFRVFNLHRNIRFHFFIQAVTKMTARDKLAFTAGKRARIDAKCHLKCRLIDVNRRKSFRLLGISDRVADGDIAETCECNDFTHLSRRNFHTLEPLIGKNLTDLCLCLMVAADENDILIRLCGTADDTANSDAPDKGIGFQRRNHHLKRCFWVAVRARNLLNNRLHQRCKIFIVIFHAVLRNTIACRRIDNGKIELIVIGFKLHEEFENFIIDIINTLIWFVDLVDDNNRLQALLECLAKNILRLRHRPFKGIHQEEDAVDHIEHPLYFAAEISMSRGIHNIDLDIFIHDRGIFR